MRTLLLTAEAEFATLTGFISSTFIQAAADLRGLIRECLIRPSDCPSLPSLTFHHEQLFYHEQLPNWRTCAACWWKQQFTSGEAS